MLNKYEYLEIRKSKCSFGSAQLIQTCVSPDLHLTPVQGKISHCADVYYTVHYTICHWADGYALSCTVMI